MFQNSTPGFFSTWKLKTSNILQTLLSKILFTLLYFINAISHMAHGHTNNSHLLNIQDSKGIKHDIYPCYPVCYELYGFLH